MTLAELDQMIQAVAPIHGINSNGVIWFKPEATEEEQIAAQNIMAAHLGELSDD